MVQGLTFENKQRLSECIKKYPALYEAPNQRSDSTKEAWTEVTKELSFLGHVGEARRQWYNIRKEYNKKLINFNKVYTVHTICISEKEEALNALRPFQFLLWINECTGEFPSNLDNSTKTVLRDTLNYYDAEMETEMETENNSLHNSLHNVEAGQEKSFIEDEFAWSEEVLDLLSCVICKSDDSNEEESESNITTIRELLKDIEGTDEEFGGSLGNILSHFTNKERNIIKNDIKRSIERNVDLKERKFLQRQGITLENDRIFE